MLVAWIGLADLGASESDAASGLGPVATAVAAHAYAEVILWTDVNRTIEASTLRQQRAIELGAQLEVLKKEQKRLVRVASASDDSVDEVVEALATNQERARDLSRALAIATQPRQRRAMPSS